MASRCSKLSPPVTQPQLLVGQWHGPQHPATPLSPPRPLHGQPCQQPLKNCAFTPPHLFFFRA